jgi:hypothetical protein
MARVSTDGGASWRHHPLNVRDLGYTPTVVRHEGKFLLMASVPLQCLLPELLNLVCE